MKKIVFSLAFICAALCVNAAGSVVGLWQTIDDETGNPKSVVRIYERDAEIFGEILFTYNEQGKPNIIDSKCDASVKAVAMDGQPPYCKLEIIKGLQFNQKSGKYEGRKKLTDPKKNKTYDAEIWLENGDLKVRGKIAFLGRTQTWKPFPQADLDKLITR